MTIENKTVRPTIIREQPPVSQKQYLSGQKDLNEAFRKALPNRFKRAFNYHKVNLKPTFFQELRACYDFAVKQGITKGPRDFTHALFDILPKSGKTSEDKRVFNAILENVVDYQRLLDSQEPRIDQPQPQPKELPVPPRSDGNFKPVFTDDGLWREVSVSSDSLFDPPMPTSDGESISERSYDSEMLYDRQPPGPTDGNGEPSMVSRIRTNLGPLPEVNENLELDSDESEEPNGLPRPPQSDDYWNGGHSIDSLLNQKLPDLPKGDEENDLDLPDLPKERSEKTIDESYYLGGLPPPPPNDET